MGMSSLQQVPSATDANGFPAMRAWPPMGISVANAVHPQMQPCSSAMQHPGAETPALYPQPPIPHGEMGAAPPMGMQPSSEGLRPANIAPAQAMSATTMTQVEGSVCKQCGFVVPHSHKFCGNCGNRKEERDASNTNGHAGTVGPVAASTPQQCSTMPAAITEPQPDGITLMLKNIPNNYTQREVVQILLGRTGFLVFVNFVYVQFDFTSKANRGFGFFNFTSKDRADEFKEQMQGFQWTGGSKKKLEVVDSDKRKGYAAHVEHFRNSPVLKERKRQCLVRNGQGSWYEACEFHPWLFKDGQQIEFPEPTKNVRNMQYNREYKKEKENL